MKHALALLFAIMFILHCASANNLQIINVALTGTDFVNDYTMISFDVYWNNSWRDVMNWDAVWLFAKYSTDAGLTWQHAWLNATPGNHSVPSAASISVGLTSISSTDRGMGVFLYRAASGSGNNSWTNVRLRWEYGAQGVADDDPVMIRVFGIEMVYVPQKSFYLGDGTTSMIAGQFENGNTGAPFLVTSEAAFQVGGTATGNLSNHNSIGCTNDFNYTTIKTLPAAFPKGYAAFYCMKYEITQEQYKDFLNTLTRTQQISRVSTPIGGSSIINRYVMSLNDFMLFRNGIRCPATLPASNPVTFYCDYDGDDIPNEYHDGQNIACNYLDNEDVQAYLDWSALRPITELEYEKTCRGPLYPQVNELAWGDTAYVLIGGVINPGEHLELPATPGMNCNAGGAFAGVIRAGMCATASTGRREAGASFYGAMEMSGDCVEQVVTAHNTGRGYTGLHGDGALTTAGDANTFFWPLLNVRGGDISSVTMQCRVSDRTDTGYTYSTRWPFTGGRGGRTAP
jgi:formylglycine-generating enzyme required for sulfatase activity